MISTEWKDRRAKCEGDAVLIGHINKCTDVTSHVAALAQVHALVDKSESHTQGHAPEELSPVHYRFLLLNCLNPLDLLCESDHSSQKGISTAYPHR